MIPNKRKEPKLDVKIGLDVKRKSLCKSPLKFNRLKYHDPLEFREAKIPLHATMMFTWKIKKNIV